MLFFTIFHLYILSHISSAMGPLSSAASPVQEIRRVLISNTSSGKPLTNFIAGTVKSNISILARTPALTPRSLLATGLRTESPTAAGLLNTSSTFVKNPTILRRSPALLASSGIHSPTVPTTSAVHTMSVSRTGSRAGTPMGSLHKISSSFAHNVTIASTSSSVSQNLGSTSMTDPATQMFSGNLSLMSTVWIRFAVRDTGVGISEEDQVRTYYI